VQFGIFVSVEDDLKRTCHFNYWWRIASAQ